MKKDRYSFKPTTVNLRIHAINKYLKWSGNENLHLRSVKIQESTFVENIISNEDYEFLKRCLREEPDLKWYFVIRHMATTGARVSELIQFKVEHVRAGFFDIYSKGGKSAVCTSPISSERKPFNG